MPVPLTILTTAITAELTAIVSNKISDYFHYYFHPTSFTTKFTLILYCIITNNIAFSALTLLAGQQEGHLAYKN